MCIPRTCEGLERMFEYSEARRRMEQEDVFPVLDAKHPKYKMENCGKDKPMYTVEDIKGD